MDIFASFMYLDHKILFINRVNVEIAHPSARWKTDILIRIHEKNAVKCSLPSLVKNWMWRNTFLQCYWEGWKGFSKQSVLHGWDGCNTTLSSSSFINFTRSLTLCLAFPSTVPFWFLYFTWSLFSNCFHLPVDHHEAPYLIRKERFRQNRHACWYAVLKFGHSSSVYELWRDRAAMFA